MGSILSNARVTILLRGVKAGYSSIDIFEHDSKLQLRSITLQSLYSNSYLKTWSLCDLSSWCIPNLVTIATKIQVVHSCMHRRVVYSTILRNAAGRTSIFFLQNGYQNVSFLVT